MIKKLIFVLCGLVCAQDALAQPAQLLQPGQILGNPTGARAPARGAFPSAFSGVGNVVGPINSIVDHVVSFNNITGTLLKDSGLLATSLVVGPASATNNHFATFDGTTGKLIKDFDLFGTANIWSTLQSFKATPASGTPGGINNALAANFFAGIAAGPYTTSQLPNVFIGRTEQIIGSTADASSALYVVSNAVGQSSGGALASQTQAIVGTADKDANSTGDVVAIFGRATGSATTSLGGVFGGFFQAIGHTTHTAPIGIEIGTVNASGVAVAYDPLFPASAASIGIDIAYQGTYFGSTSANGTVAIVIRGDGALNAWDVGIGVLGGGASISPNSVSKAVIQDDSSATNVFLFNSGAHAYGIRGTGATYSTAALAFPGFTVSGTGALTATTLTSASISTGQYTFNNQSNIVTGPGFSHSTGNAFLFAGGSSGFQFNNNAGTLGLMTLSNTGSLGLIKMTASGSAPGAAAIKLEAVAGTNAGTCKLIMYAGTSATAVTILDNVGAGC